MLYDDEELLMGGRSVTEYATYEDFLESLVSEQDRKYLNDIALGQNLVELGKRGDKEGFSKKQFLACKAAIEVRKAVHGVKTAISAGRTFEEPMLRALQMREEANRSGKNATIIYIRDRDQYGQEVSGYIDYAYRLATQDFRPIFDGEKRLMPRKTDLSFYNWNVMKVSSRDSPNYEVIARNEKGMLFRNKRDGKYINPDPFVGQYGENTSRTVIPTTAYISVIMFDHYNRRRI